MSVGQELLDVPFPEMIASMGQGIADAQNQLDMNSVEVAKVLAETEIEVVPAITRTIDSEGEVTYSPRPRSTSRCCRPGCSRPSTSSRAVIEVEMDIKTTTERETDIDVSAEAHAGFGLWGGSIQTDVSHNRKFGKEVHGTSKLKTTMVPVPEPPYLFPEVETIDQRQPEDNEE